MKSIPENIRGTWIIKNNVVFTYKPITLTINYNKKLKIVINDYSILINTTEFNISNILNKKTKGKENVDIYNFNSGKINHYFFLYNNQLYYIDSKSFIKYANENLTINDLIDKIIDGNKSYNNRIYIFEKESNEYTPSNYQPGSKPPIKFRIGI